MKNTEDSNSDSVKQLLGLETIKRPSNYEDSNTVYQEKV